jgi:hypothetical protein
MFFEHDLLQMVFLVAKSNNIGKNLGPYHHLLMSCFHMATLHHTWYSIGLKCKTALVHYLAAKKNQGASLVDR